MGVKFTTEQEEVIKSRGSNLLVSAAAGSGKTAVLVERIIRRLTQDNPPLNVDQLLVVTYTDAAAAEMKDRIREAIEKALEQDPKNEHLQRQASLIHQANISTMHTFYTSVIHDNFHILDLEPNVRVAETGEIELIKRDVLEQVLEEAYKNASEEFFSFVECYVAGKDDTALEDLVMQVYKKAQSHPNPHAWLDMCVQQYAVESVEELEQKTFVRDILMETKKGLEYWKKELEYAVSICESENGPLTYVSALESDMAQIDAILQKNSFLEIREGVQGYVRETLKSKKKTDVVDEEKQERVKELRKGFVEYKDKIKKQYYAQDFADIQESMTLAKKQVKTLVGLVEEFGTCFAQEKRKKNVIDFDDMERFALQILTKEVDGAFVPSDIAKGYQEKFAEIMIDEYQDINRLQDIIMTSVSGVWNGNYNLFMVGDVKQSIYSFRLSCPELFMEKYHRYSEDISEERRIDLHKNFRSRSEVLDSTNFLFEQIMTGDFGGILYDKNAALNVGATYPEGENKETEVLFLDLPGILAPQRLEIETQLVAQKIKDLVGKHMIYDRKTETYRKAKYSDIVILTRKARGVGEAYAKALKEAGIPTYMESREGYFQSYEIQLILNYLRILDNPRQDIPFTAVLSSLFGKVTAEELAILRNHSQGISIYECVREYLKTGPDGMLKTRLNKFHELFERLRELVPYTAIHELLWCLLDESGFMEYMAVFPNGEQRVANLEMLVEKATTFETSSYKGLFNFVRYMGLIEKYEVENGPANLVDEQMNAVTLMTIHKSKGLEFPIVFVARCGSEFNNKSAQGPIGIHSDIGIGLDAIDPEARTSSSTLLKKAISQKIIEQMSEEEARLLYVAMTRAKEKLFLVADCMNLEGKFKGLESLAEQEEVKLPYYQLTTAKSFLDWIVLALYRHQSMAPILREIGKESAKVTSIYTREVPITVDRILLEEIQEKEIEEQFKKDIAKEVLATWDVQTTYNQEVKAQLEEQLSYVYPYHEAQLMKQKFSVSELKKQSYLQEEGEEAYREEEVFPLLPKFLKNDEELTGASRGTAYHKVMELLDFSQDYDMQLLRNEIANMKERKLLTEEMAASVRVEDILKFFESNIGKRMQIATSAQKCVAEQPFVLGMPANIVYPERSSEEMVLVQGIIDAYFEEDGELIVVDYKTDRVTSLQELRERYHTQLEYYAEALQRLTGKRVKEKIIYSFALKQEIGV